MNGAVNIMPRKATKYSASLPQNFRVSPQALFRLELLTAGQVLDLRAISEVVSSDPGLMAHMVQLLQESDDLFPACPSVEECVVELGREGMRRCVRNARSIDPYKRGARSSVRLE